MSLIQIFDNIGCDFYLHNHDFIIGASLPGYNTLNETHVGASIPYLVRNLDNQNNILGWEIGIGLVLKDNLKIIIQRTSILQSGGSLETGNKKHFYIFANADSYNSGFNNVIVKDKDFTAGSVKATYLIDASSGLIHATLPRPESCSGIEIQFKIISDNDGRLDIKDDIDFHTIIRDNSYISIVSDGKSWHILDKSQEQNLQAFSSQSLEFSTLSDPSGNDGSFQYKDGSLFKGADIYWGANNKLVLGSGTNEITAKHIIPTSGDFDTIINNSKNKSDFIVYGSGVPAGYLPKNLIFTYDGKLGLNIPSGSKPQTALHIVNNSCRESIRIENLSSCPSHTPNITLYHKPSGVDSGTTIGKILLSSRDSNKNKADYAQINAIAKSTTAGSTKGQLNLSVASGASMLNTVVADPDFTTIGYPSGHQLIVGNGSGIRLYNNISSGVIALNSNNITISSTNVGISANTMNFSGVANFNQAMTVNGNSVAFPQIAQNQILAINSSGYLAPAQSFSISGVGANKLLTTNSNGLVIGSLPDNAYLASYNDIIWSKYTPRSATICLRQMTPVEDFPANEFTVGDQIAIITGVAPNEGTIYRTISEINLAGNLISYILVDQNVTSVDSAVRCYSVTKGGVLSNQLATQNGVESDATSIILSTRPETDTIFNTKQRNINFKVFGSETNPSLSILAKASLQPIKSGVWHKYSTQFKDQSNMDIDPFATLVNSNGEGIGSANNSANYGNVLSPLWSSRVTTVGSNGRRSFYGTYDQNGNVYEWVEDNNSTSTSTTQNVCGGSWRTLSANGMRSVIATPYSLELDDVGFRICSRFGYSNPDINQRLDLNFVPVSDIDNIPDTSIIFTESYTNRSGLNLPPTPTSIPNIGKVNQPYQISIHEVTNAQYAAFLNAVNKISSYELYNSNMSGSLIGGIDRSGSDGSYVYSAKVNMDNKPVVFVDYLSSIRYINWLHNGAPTGEAVTAADTEDGAYSIISGVSSITISKNRDQKYWLPSLNEWHKAAYFRPVYSSVESDKSAVLIRRDTPYAMTSGNLASLSVSGAVYSDYLIVGNSAISSGSLLSAINPDDTTSIVNIGKGYPHYAINIGPTGAIVIDAGSEDWDGAYSSYISASNGIQLATSGEIKFISPTTIKASGLSVDDIFIKNITYIDPVTNAPVAGGIYPGPNGGFLFKDLTTDNPKATQYLSILSLGDTGSGVALSGASRSCPVFTNDNGVLDSYDNLQFGSTVDGIDGSVVKLVSTETAAEGEAPPPGPAFITDRIRIGPVLSSYKGNILTHDGEGVAVWKEADFLRADGMTWNRNIKRAIDMVSRNTIRFSQLDSSRGGTGAVTEQTILNEFAISDTIAIYNQAKQVAYAKIADIVLITDVPDQQFFTNRSTLEITICPPLTDAFLANNGSDLVQGQRLAYAFSVQKGGYLDMGIEQSATSGFDCTSTSTTSQYRFKPSTAATISIRPTIHTAFNKVAEDIDFAVYSYRKTLFNRYEPSLFSRDSGGLPSGLIPAFYVDAYRDNSFIGSVSSGVINTNASVIASGILPDESAKITINTKNPYVVAKLPGLRTGFISPDSVRPTGEFFTTTEDISTYADLTVNGYTFSSGIITTELVLKNTPNRIFIPNAPLTVNSLGQLVSIIPPPQPTVPLAPSGISGFGANASARLSWDLPTSDGNSPIINYIVQYSENSSDWTTFNQPTITDTSCLVTGLQNGVSYVFRVYAVNAIGTSPASSPSPTITPTTNAPTAPLNLRVINRNTHAITLDWDVPSYQGPGSQTIQNYIAEYAEASNPPGRLNWVVWGETIGSTSNVTIDDPSVITGPEPTYWVRVRAQNSTTTGAYALLKIVGTDEEPIPVEPEPEPTNDWDFGEIAFTGVCV